MSILKQEGVYKNREAFFEDVFGELNLKPKFKSKFRFIDLFAGIGGMRLGFQNAGGTCVFSSEFDKHAQQTYKLNHGEQPFGDITKITPEYIPDHDVLLGGFPCQAFSVAGYRKGFDDEKGRGNLFINIFEILLAKRPKLFLLENVKNLLGHDKGRTYKTIVEYLNKAGYSVREAILNTKDHSDVPQNRERIFIVGFKESNDTDIAQGSINFKWPQEVKNTQKFTDLLENEVEEEYYYDRFDIYPLLKEQMTNPNTAYQWRRVYVRENKNNVCPTLTANMGTGGHNVPLILTKKGRIRKLSPIECSRIQGFPNKFSLPKMAKSHLYKQFGNSVSVPVIEKLAYKIITHL